jgi:L-asparaginase II
VSTLTVESTRGGLIESVHRVSAVVVDSKGKTLASAGDVGFSTFIRSAAKPFQAVPLIDDGVIERFAITEQELALACGSHSSERSQVDRVRALLGRLALTEGDLACGPHRPLGRDLIVLEGTRRGAALDLADPSPAASNCSGKHAGMLALARHHGWDTRGYHRKGHPVQDRARAELARASGVPEGQIGEAVDGCGVVAFAIPLDTLARAYAALVTSARPAYQKIAAVMMRHADMVAGQHRLCTELMRLYPDRLLVKVGAEGVYAAAIVDRGLGIALKVEDGNGRAAMVALMAVLDQLGVDPPPSERLPWFACIELSNTRDEVVGHVRAAGRLTFA